MIAAPLIVVALHGCAHKPSRPSGVDPSWASLPPNGAMLPDRLTIHPFTHAVPGGGGRASVMVYVELRDRFNQHTRALGRMKLSILPPRTPTAEGDYTAETPRDSTWFIELFDPERNAQLFDDMVTRTYVFTLGELPDWLNAWVAGTSPTTPIIIAEFTFADPTGTPRSVRNTARLSR